jgi:hypothetical protein
MRSARLRSPGSVGTKSARAFVAKDLLEIPNLFVVVPMAVCILEDRRKGGQYRTVRSVTV